MVVLQSSQIWPPLLDEDSLPPESGIRLAAPSARQSEARSRLVHEVMSWPAHPVNPFSSTCHALAIVERLGLHHLPVVTFDELIGVVCACDLREAPRDALVHEYMSDDPVTIDANASLIDAADLMEVSDTGCLLVTWNGSFGVLTHGDLCRAGLLDPAERLTCASCGAHQHMSRFSGGPCCPDCSAFRRDDETPYYCDIGSGE